MTIVMDVDGWDSDAGVGFKVTEAAPRRDSPSRAWQVAQTTAPEHTLLSPVPLFDLRPFEVRGFIESATAAAHVSALDELKARLKGQVASSTRNEVALEFDDRAGKEYVVRVVDVTTEPVNQARTAVDLVTIRSVMLDPFLRDSTPTTVNGITTTPTDIAIGTAPSWPILTINAAFTDPRIDLKNSSGSVVKTMSFTIDSATESITDLIIDMQAGTIVDNTGANRHSHRDSGGNFPWMIEPQDGVYWTSAWPTLECSSGTLDVSHTKRWE
jgi:hypothetical protein